MLLARKSRLALVVLAGLGLLALTAAMPMAAYAAKTLTLDDLFRSPATPQDTALVAAIKGRLQAAGAASSRTTSPAAPGAQAGAREGAQALWDWWIKVGVDARNGHVRLNGSTLTPQQRAAVEGVVRGTQGVQSCSWDWGNRAPQAAPAAR